VLVELERAWPTFVRPAGLAPSCAAPGAQVAVPFDVAVSGDYAVRVHGFAGPEGGDYDLVLDGEPLARWSGYAPAAAPSRTGGVRRALASGRHVLVARCAGRDPGSAGYDARLDAVVGEAVTP
jgi:hypothetical protein